LASSPKTTFPLLFTALLLAIALAGGQQQQQGYATVTVNADPPECVARVAVFSQSRNVPVQVSKAGEGVWVSEPVPRGDWLAIAYEQATGCMNYILVNEATLEKYYGMDRTYLYANYNVTLTVKAVKQTTQPPQPPPQQEPPPNMLQQILQAILPAAPTIAVFAAIPTAGYIAYRVARTAVERYREREGERYMLRKAAAFFSEGSRNPIIRRGWLWMDIDPAAEIASGRDNNRKIAAYLKLARVLPTSRERMRDLERETIERFEKYAMPAAIIGQRRYRPEVEDVGESLIRYAVELAIDDPEVEKAIGKLGKAGIDPYTIPREFAGIDELIKNYRGVSMEELGFKYAGEDERRFEKCPHCGGKTLKGSKYCTSCGTELRAKVGITLPKLQLHKPRPVVERKCPSCGTNLLPGAKHCHRCGAKVVPATEAAKKPETPPKIIHESEPKKTPQQEPEEEVPSTAYAMPPPPTPTKPKQTTPIPSQRPPTETNITAPKTTPEKPTPEPKPETAETVKIIEQPSTPKTPQPVILRETPKEEEEVEWEPDEDLSETLKAVRVDPREFKHEAVRLAASNLDERGFEKELFRSADKLISKIEGLDLDSQDALRLSLTQHLRGAVHEIRKLMKPPEPPRKAVAKPAAPQPEQAWRLEPSRIAPEAPPSPAPPTQLSTTVTPPAQPQASKPRPEPVFQHIEPETLQPPLPQPRVQATPPIQQQTPKPETVKQKTDEEYTPYESVLRGEFKEKTVTLLPIKRSALPTALIAKQAGIFNLEWASKHLPSREVICQTRTTYRANYKNSPKPSPSHPYVKRVIRAVSSGHGIAWVITEEVYNMEEVRKEFEEKGYKPVKAKLDTEASRRRLEKIMHPKHAAKLAVAGALIPWLADELGANGWEGVRRRLIDLLGAEDGEEVFQTLTEAVKENPEYPNKPLAVSLGVLDEGE
jgi:uncharacterized OB-fold protein